MRAKDLSKKVSNRAQTERADDRKESKTKQPTIKLNNTRKHEIMHTRNKKRTL